MVLVPTCHPERAHYAKGLCSACYQKQWREQGPPDRQRAYSQKWNKAHRDEIRAKRAAYRAAHRTPRRPQPRKPLADRYWAKVIQSPDGCWDWAGSKDEHGYGRIGSGGKRGAVVEAHRVSWEIHNGPIPDGLSVLHSCDNPPCSRPDHLFIGTQADNLRDATNKGRMSPPPLHVGEDAAKSKLNADQVRDIRREASVGTSLLALARRYGVAHSTTKRIANRKTWKHVA